MTDEVQTDEPIEIPDEAPAEPPAEETAPEVEQENGNGDQGGGEA